MQLSQTVSQLQPSATMAAAAKAKAMAAEGIRVLNFTLGEPDFTTPEHIREAAKTAMDAGHTHYTPATGTPEMKQAVCDAAKRDHGLDIAPNRVCVSNGAKHAIHNVLTTLLDPGDEVLIPTPYWVSYSALVELTGATCRFVETTEANGFCLTAEQLRGALTPATKLIMFNNPSNPTGGVYPPERLEELAAILGETDTVVLSDEIYNKLRYEGAGFRSLLTFPAIADQTVVVDGVSKAYAMTGWRIGWSITPPEVAAAIGRLQGQQTSNPCSVSQKAAVAALTGDQSCVGEMLEKFTERRTFVLDRLRKIPGVTFAEPGGAFYAFFNVADYFGRPLPGGAVDSSTEFCTRLLEEAHVALVTGDAFGAPGYVRLSFATDLDTLDAGLTALEGFLAAAR